MEMEKMDGMEMPVRRAPALEESMSARGEVAGSLGLPMDECTHCVSHSQLGTAPVPGIGAEQSKRVGETLAPLPSRLVSTFVAALKTSLTTRTHAPPGASAPRHVLINIFRI
jgi:hypothetical protein